MWEGGNKVEGGRGRVRDVGSEGVMVAVREEL